MKKKRLDTLLVERGCFPDGEAALRAVIAHEVKVDDVYAESASMLVFPEADIVVKGRKRFVSRGGYKLAAALDAFGLDVGGMRCLDIGASTGGFTDCLLQAGAAHVVCVDVGYGQLAWTLRQDGRVEVFDRLNIRRADPERLGAPFDLIVVDVSFIGLVQLAPVFAKFAAQGTILVGLIKPQFESCPGESDHGVVNDPRVHARVVDEVYSALEESSFSPTGVITSPVKGADGNTEFLIHAVFDRLSLS